MSRGREGPKIRGAGTRAQVMGAGRLPQGAARSQDTPRMGGAAAAVELEAKRDGRLTPCNVAFVPFL